MAKSGEVCTDGAGAGERGGGGELQGARLSPGVEVDESAKESAKEVTMSCQKHFPSFFFFILFSLSSIAGKSGVRICAGAREGDDIYLVTRRDVYVFRRLVSYPISRAGASVFPFLYFSVS